MAQSEIQCVLCAAFGLGDVSNKQNNILKREAQPLFPVYTYTVMSNSDPCPGTVNFCHSLGQNVGVISLAKHPNTRVNFSRFSLSISAGLVCQLQQV